MSAALACALVFSFAGCAKISYIANGTKTAISEIKDGSWKETEQPVENTGEPSQIVIDPFVAGTYGGVEFATEDDVVNYYVECYDNTKAQTAKYIDADGNTQEFYAFVGEEKMIVEKILVDGTANQMLNSIVPGIVETAFQYNVYGLPPCNNRNPLLDNTNGDAANPGAYDLRTSHFKPEYSLASNVKENADGTITITIQPKDASMSVRGEDSQGSFFEVLNDLGATVDQLFTDYSMLSWASGTTEENCLVNYKGGTGTVTIDPATKTITSADYHMSVTVEVKHANVTAIKDKNGTIIISHDLHYPASDKYIYDAKTLTRA